MSFDANRFYSIRAYLTRDINEPIVSEKAFELHPDTIISFNIIESVLTILPKFEMVLTDKGTIIEQFPILDKDVLTVIIGNDPESEPILTCSFIISGIKAESDTQQMQGNYIRLNGYLATQKSFIINFKRVFSGSSDEVLNNIATEIGLKFNADAKGAEFNDWYQYGTNYQFIKHISERAFVPNDGVYVYGDTKGQLNYTTIQTKISKGVRFTAKYSMDRVENKIKIEEENTIYFDAFDIINISEIYNNIANYGGTYIYYDLTDNIELDVRNPHKTTDMYNRKEMYTAENAYYFIMGSINDSSISQTMFHGMLANNTSRYSIFSNTIAITINSSTPINLFDVIDIKIPSTIERGKGMAEPYSGEYVVLSISNALTKNTPYSKTIMLGRSGINKPTVEFEHKGVS